MIVVLALRFRRHIALFLYIVLYAEWVAAAEVHRYGSHTREGAPTQVTVRLPEVDAPEDYGIDPMTDVDSNVVPGVRQGVKDIAASPSFRLPQAPLAGKNMIPTAMLTSSDKAVKASIGGPNQPEMQSFSPVGANNMVDLFSGDFSYNIPLLDVGGYPVNIAYHSGRSMDEDASWVGLGWNINPGSITRDMRGLPDDFNGGNDTVTKTTSMKPNISWGMTAGANLELVGLPVGIGASAGIFHTTYNGWGLETGFNPSISAGDKSTGTLTGSLSISNNSQSGLTLTPGIDYQTKRMKVTDNVTAGMGFSVAAPYNSRSGLKDIQLNMTPTIQSKAMEQRKKVYDLPSAGITFAWPAYTPEMQVARTNYNVTFTMKPGTAADATHPNFYFQGYYGREYIADADTTRQLPAYGYLNSQNRGSGWSALTDLNREKEMVYRESPAVPHIAIPSYTYDVFSMSGEGNGGQFRAYRGDMGFMADALLSSKTTTGALSLDLGGGNLIHGGTDLNANYSVTTDGPWLLENPLGNLINFRNPNGLFEASYFRNPGEKTSNTKDYYKAIGGDYTVTPMLSQPGGGATIMSTNILGLYNGAQKMGTDTLTSSNVVKTTRDKRNQVISYLTAQEASVTGLDKYINRYNVNQFGNTCSSDPMPTDAGVGSGLSGDYFTTNSLSNYYTTRLDPKVYFAFFDGESEDAQGSPFYYNHRGHKDYSDRNFPREYYSMRWLGRLKAPESGTYSIGFYIDDGTRIWMNDTLLINDWHIHGAKWDKVNVNLVAGRLYNFRAEYFQWTKRAYAQLTWLLPSQQGQTFDQNHNDTLQTQFLFPPVTTDTIPVNQYLTREDRVNDFRKSSHISEIDVQNPDGKRYVYGIPVYNVSQNEVSFNAVKDSGDIQTGLTGFKYGTDNSTHNTNGQNGYYTREKLPAYAHSFLLTGILSPDYQDVTGDGISDDDIGDAVHFTYSKTAGIGNPFGWRAPYVTGKASYSEGLKSYNRDDKGHYIYGTKELWYLHTIESKTMIATFKLQPRADMMEIDEYGNKSYTGKAMSLQEINLYSKADFMANGTAATPIKTVHFEYSYELCRGVNAPVNDSGKLTLKKIWFTYNGNKRGQVNPYIFNYHANNPRFQFQHADKWGNYKDPAQNPGSTVANPIPNSENPYALQDSATAAYNAGAWMLDSITLPSGGRIKVNYESDDYAYVQNRRATLMCGIAGLGTDTSGHFNNRLYNFLTADNLYVYVKVPYSANWGSDLFSRYLEGLDTLHFRLFVTMPKDDFGSGGEYIPCYANPDKSASRWYGRVNDHMIWIKLRGVNSSGTGDGNYSPLAQTAINYLRLNLGSKAYPGSEVNDNLSISDGVKILLSQVTNITGMLSGFNNTARGNGWASVIDTAARSFVRLDDPFLKKYGGGLRVKSVLIYDSWNAMTQKTGKGMKETVYGQQYDYSTNQSVNGVNTSISSGVATWEPTVGGEENPFHMPIEYVDRVSMLAPASMQYTEAPLGETFYPAPSIGYSKVRVRSIHTANTRSSNGWSESNFYTSYDFPVLWDYTRLDPDTKMRYKPILGNLLRINQRNYLTLSQGFKVELNDMNGKPKSEATYAETDSNNLISYTGYYYRVDNQSVQSKHLNNTVPTINAAGTIDPNGMIGKDAEIMTDMRDQTSVTTGANVNLNVDIFAAGVWPLAIPSLLNLYQHETTQFRSVAMTKVVQRYGILDSVVHIDKGSTIYTKNLLYDEETGDAILTRTQNEFNDSIFSFSYPSHWAYKSIGGAYQNIDAVLSHVNISHGQLLDNNGAPIAANNYLMPGDEVYATGRVTISPGLLESFPNFYKLWVIDSIPNNTGTPAPSLVDEYGTPFSSSDVTLKVVRSGYKNMGTSVGAVTSLGNPMVLDSTGAYHLVLDSTRRVLNASAAEMSQLWRVADKKRSDVSSSCIYTAADSATAAGELCGCIKPIFDWLQQHGKMYYATFPRMTVQQLADSAGVSLSSCPLLQSNATGVFKPLTRTANTTYYQAMLGGLIFNINSVSGRPFNINNMVSSCNGSNQVLYKVPGLVVPPPDTLTINVSPSFVNLISSIGTSCPSYIDTLLTSDSTADHLLVENSLLVNGSDRNIMSVLNFGRLDKLLPPYQNIISANLILHADTRGHIPGTYDSANSTLPNDSLAISLTAPAGWFPYQNLDTLLYQAYYAPWYKGVRDSVPFEDVNIDMTDYVDSLVTGVYGSTSFALTKGSGPMHSNTYDSTLVALDAVPPYLTNGYSNYYGTFFSPKYADASKRPVLQIKYVVYPIVDTSGALLVYNSTMNCTTVTGRSCYSAVTDTMVNPYKYAILGDYRPLRSFVYYGQRKETDPLAPVSIRTAGTIPNFAPFWVYQSASGKWAPTYDSSRWVWNSQTTLFNRKGFELENKDPLGRYNSGLYGYGLTMPTAVIQNSHYQESAFEGFEDYGFVSNSCDNACPEARPFDFSAYTANISDSAAHTGLYSLRIAANSNISLVNLPVVAGPNESDPSIKDTAIGGSFAGQKTSANTVIPPFEPFAGKKMLIGAWVKEMDSCSCQAYTNDHIIVNFPLSGGGATSFTLTPSGNVIEGWQRYEAIVTIPATATSMTISLAASATATTYFDDIRIHPFNGEMKSYVYNSVNLRLMAELDENNYATYYEYDDDGTLIRVKKETERGIMTIKETRSALYKN